MKQRLRDQDTKDTAIKRRESGDSATKVSGDAGQQQCLSLRPRYHLFWDLVRRLTGNVGIDTLTVGMEGKEMADSSVVSTKGQVAVPKKIRARLGLRVGDRVEFVVQGNHTIIRPVRPAGNPFAKYIGALPAFPGGAKEINAWVRSMRDEE